MILGYVVSRVLMIQSLLSIGINTRWRVHEVGDSTENNQDEECLCHSPDVTIFAPPRVTSLMLGQHEVREQ